MALDTINLFLSIFFWGSPIGFSYLLGHFGALIISYSSVQKLSTYSLFWILLIAVFFTASEPRFTLEYFLVASAFFVIGASSPWINYSLDKRRSMLILIFLLLIVANKLKFGFSEKGSLLLWLPVFLSLYFEKVNKKNIVVYLISGVALFLSNKFTTLLAFVTTLRSRLTYLVSVIAVAGYFLVKHNFWKFLEKSLEPRIYIWKSTLVAFLDKPLWGHGFGTFAIDFPLYRAHAKVLGGKVSEQVAHGHSFLHHYLFELGLIGVVLCLILFYLIYLNVPRALPPFLVICLFDSPLVSFSQFLLGGLLFLPFIKRFGILEKLFIKESSYVVKKIAFVSIIVIMSFSFIPSIVGHYFYTVGNIDTAITFDKNNSLYYFTRGAGNLNVDTEMSEVDLKRAINLSPNVPYFYGFLGAAQLANGKTESAKESLKRAMKLDGKDGYWCLLYSYANYENKIVYKRYMKKAIKKNPEIKDLLLEPDLTAAKYIGRSKYGDIRIPGFYRTGKRIFFPLPIIEK